MNKFDELVNDYCLLGDDGAVIFSNFEELLFFVDKIRADEREACAKVCEQWVGLTDEEIYDYADKFLYQHGSNYGIRPFGKAIEQALKEKNT